MEAPTAVAAGHSLRPDTLARGVGLGAAVLPATVVALLGVQGLAAVPAGQRGAMLALIAAQALPLLVRSRLPMGALFVTAGAAVAQMLLGLPDSNAMLGQAVATATVVSRLSWPRSVIPAAVVMACNTLAALLGDPQTHVVRHVIVTGATLLLAWAVGDAVGRRATARAAREVDVALREASGRWTAELEAMGERLRIAEKLHVLVGDALDAIVVQAGAARVQLARASVDGHLRSIESTGRDVMSRLDQFLAMLRSGGAEQDVAAQLRVPLDESFLGKPRQRFTGYAGAVMSGSALVLPVLVVAALAGIENFSVPADQSLEVWAVASLTAAVSVPLLVRRRWPRAALVAVASGSAVQLVFGMPVGNGVMAVPVGAHAVAVHHGWRPAVRWGLSSTAVLFALDTPLDVADGVELAVVLTIAVLGAAYIGDATRVTRAQDASLERRLAAVHEQRVLAEKAAIAAERTRAARDLHDSIGHTMSLVVIQAGAARVLAATGDETTRARISHVLEAIEQAARDALTRMDPVVGAVVGEVDPVTNECGAEDLSVLVARVRAAGTPVTLSCADLADLSAPARRTVFHIVQEALTNVMKHAPGAPAAVRIDRTPQEVQVRVTNERGRSTSGTLPSGGRGLVGMQERVAQLDGELSTGPTAEGFVVDAVIPTTAPERMQGEAPAPFGREEVCP